MSGSGACCFAEFGGEREARQALADLPADDIAARFDASRLDADDIYPSGWDEQGRREWLSAEYECVRDFYLDAAGEGRAVLLWLD